MSNLTTQIYHYKPLIHRVLDSGRAKYTFTNVLYHQLLISKKQFADANRNYALEIIYRFHAASLITLRRNLAWIESIQLAKNNSLYFAFCSSLRGLIESAADSFYSLRYVPQNLATYFKTIKTCIENKEKKRLHLFKELEDWGIHFLEAGKYEDKKLDKEHFKAKSTWEYLKSIDSESALKPVYPLYQKLCQITHPSRETTYLFFKSKNDHWVVEDINEKEEIEKLENSYDKEYEEFFQKSFNTSLLILWIIDLLPIEELKCPIVRNINFNDIGEYRKIKKIILSNKRLR